MTFDSNISIQNHERITQTITQKYGDIQNMIIDVVNKVNRLIKHLKI